MKRITAAVILLTMLAFGCFGAYRYVVHTTKQLDAAAGQVLSDLKSGDFPAAQQQMDRGYQLWHSKRRPLSAMVRHNELDDIDRLYQRTRQALDNEDLDEALLQLRELRTILLHLPEMEAPSYSNIL